jgi:hypothetical protein
MPLVSGRVRMTRAETRPSATLYQTNVLGVPAPAK